MDSDLWLNSVLATPALGVRLGSKPSSIFRLPSIIAPFLDALQERYDEVGVTSSAAETSLETGDGYVHKFAREPSGINLVAQFQFSPTEEKSPGSLPTVSYGRHSFGETLETVSERMKAMLKAAMALEQSSVRRIGLLVQAQLTAEQLPRGAANYRDWLSGPWKKERGELVHTNCTVTVRWPAKDGTKFSDQCHHGLKFDVEDKTNEISLMLDFQRAWKDGIALSQAASEIDLFKKASVAYFQDFAFGERVWPV